MRLLSVSADAKTRKGEKQGILTGILYLAPANLSGREVCRFRSPGCTESCLYTAGRGIMGTVQQGRMRKTELFFRHRGTFMTQLEADIRALVRKAARENYIPAVRLNGTSDLPWERIRNPHTGLTILETFPEVQFYDYTKDVSRMGKMPQNYDLTFSRSEINGEECNTVLRNGGRVVMVFAGEIPEQIPSADDSDARFLDGAGAYGLKAKGRARKDKSGFVL